MDGYVAEDADVGSCVVGSVCSFGFVEVWCECWCVWRGKSVVWCDGDVQLAAANGVIVDAVVVEVVDDVEKVDGWIAVCGSDDGEKSIGGGSSASVW